MLPTRQDAAAIAGFGVGLTEFWGLIEAVLNLAGISTPDCVEEFCGGDEDCICAGLGPILCDCEEDAGWCDCPEWDPICNCGDLPTCNCDNPSCNDPNCPEGPGGM